MKSDPMEFTGRRQSPGQVRSYRSQKLESLGRMAGGIAHDFNNLLLAIMGNAELLDQDLKSGKDGFPLLDEIRKAAGRAADLCGQLLAFSGKGQFNLKPLDLSATARGMYPMLKVAIFRGVTLRLDLKDDLPLIHADAGQLHQVIMNLVVNASEAIGSAEGTITVSTRTQEIDLSRIEHCVIGEIAPRGKFVSLEVRDTGEGMDGETLERIFDPFFTTKVQGRGLGLASVLGIVRGHQAVLCVESKSGEGSCFQIHFPLAEIVSHLPGKPRLQAGGRVEGATVLVVDDEEYIRVLSRRMLGRLGHHALLAPDGLRALEIFREKRAEIDVVMLDLVMPVMDGVQVFEELKRLDPAVRVVMTSGYHQQEITTRFAGKGIQGFLQKPYVIADLDEVMGKMVESGLKSDPSPVKPGPES